MTFTQAKKPEYVLTCMLLSVSKLDTQISMLLKETEHINGKLGKLATDCREDNYSACKRASVKIIKANDE